ncbi:MAG: hypothetical protein ACI9SX_001229 [Pseudoalteromonas tetraodonis]|jgi:hypothetical protein
MLIKYYQPKGSDSIKTSMPVMGKEPTLEVKSDLT